jgi:3D-(3,5/4)-trihydroxycyclohexane-1,2-dione acylhydrolase (decyclizing)
VPSYAQVIAVVNAHATENDTMVTAAGGLPGETAKNWRVKAPNTYDLEFGFSCMGYEIAGGWGHAMAKTGADGTQTGVPIVMVGDGSYMMMNSDIYSTVLSGHKMVVVVCDNGGFGVINRLQTGMGVPGFNNLLKDARVKNRETRFMSILWPMPAQWALKRATAKVSPTLATRWIGRRRQTGRPCW